VRALPKLLRWAADLVREMNRMMDVAYGKEAAGKAVRDEPTVEFANGGEEVVIRAGLPGVEKEDVDLTLSRRGVITVSGISRGGSGEADRYSVEDLQSLSYDTFRHTVDLPEGYDESTARAWFEADELKITVRKSARSPQSRRIEVEAPGTEGA
jgi:HSP20 family protein